MHTLLAKIVQPDLRIGTIRKHLEKEGENRILEHFVPLVQEGGIFILGGYIRRILQKLSGLGESPPSDLDVVAFFKEGWCNEVVKFADKVTKTPLGGVRWILDGKRFSTELKWVDVWDIRDNINIRLQGIEPCIENVILGGPLNLDRICFNVKNNTLLDAGCLNGLKNRKIIYNPPWEYLPHIQLFRGCLFCERLKFDADYSLKILSHNCKWADLIPGIKNYFDGNACEEAMFTRCLKRVTEWANVSLE